MKLFRSLFLAVGLLAAAHIAMAGGRNEGKDHERDVMPRHEQQSRMIQGAEAAAPYEIMEEGQGAVVKENAPLAEPQLNPGTGNVEAESSQREEYQNLKVERMSRAEKKAMKARFRANRKDLRDKVKANRKARDESEQPGGDTELLLLVIVAILLPPLAVGLYEGITTNFWIDLLLTLLFYIPGLIFALVVILR